MNKPKPFVTPLSRYKLAAVAAVALLLIGIGWVLHHRGALPSMWAKPVQERKVLYWHDPMVPGTRFDKPGKSPFMDMQLVPVYADEQVADTGVTIDGRTQQNLGVRRARVELGGFSSQLDAVGIIKPDERRIQAVSSRTAGWLENPLVHSVGDVVQRDQVVAEIYSPDLVAAQEEFLLAKKMQNGGGYDELLLRAARMRLQTLGLSAQQVNRFESSGEVQHLMPILAQSNGIVSELNARAGAYVPAGSSLMMLTDLSSVWLIVDVPEHQAVLLKNEASADIRFAALPGKVFPGKVDYIYPGVTSATRTVKARIQMENPTGELRPEMLASVTLHNPDEPQVLMVPSEAVIATGKRNVVVVATASGRFTPVDVVTGRERDGKTEVLQGLQDGQIVVVSGQFLIDSESSLKTMLKRFDEAPSMSTK